MIRTWTRNAALLSCLALSLSCGADGRAVLPSCALGESLSWRMPLHPGGEPRETDSEENSPEPVEQPSSHRTHRQATVRASQPTVAPALLSPSAAGGRGLACAAPAAAPGQSFSSYALHLFHCVWLC